MKRRKKGEKRMMHDKRSRITLLTIFVLIILAIASIFFVFAESGNTAIIDYVDPTPANNTYTSNLSIGINITINESSLSQLNWSWNNTNYSFYDSSLLLMFNFDNVSAIGENSTFVMDVSTYGNNGTLYNGTAICGNTADCPKRNTSGKYGSAMQLDGVNDYINVNNGSSLNITNSITISAWMNPLGNGWNYKRPITLSLATSQTDYQVKIELNTSNFNYSKANSNGGDLRFYQVNGTSLNYWIEEWNTTNTSTIWVKVATQGTNTIYMYYGNPTASSESNGTMTFKFFDDFEDNSIDTNKWAAYGDLWSETGGQLEIPDSGASNESFSWAVTRNFNVSDGVIETRMTPYDVGSSQGKGVAFRFSGSSDSYLATSEAWYVGKIDIGKRVAGTWTNLANVDMSGGVSISVPYKQVIKFSGSSFSINVTNLNSLQTSSTSASDTALTGNKSVGLIVDRSETDTGAKFEYFFVREYNLSEPNIIIGNETATGISKAGSYGIGANTTTVFASINNQTISGAISAGWNHLALTYDKDAGGTNEMKLYINGVEKASHDHSSVIMSSVNNILIGAYFNGSIDEIRIYNRSLSADEINQSYYSNLYKYASDGWQFYTNQTNLSDGTYTYKVYTQNTSGQGNQTLTRTIMVGMPQLSYASPTPANNTYRPGTSVYVNLSMIDNNPKTFRIIWNGTSNVTAWDRNLVATWYFSEGSGNASDSSGNNNWVNISGATWNSSGRFGNALSFDGEDDYASTNLSHTSTNISIEFWARDEGSSVWHHYVDNDGVQYVDGQKQFFNNRFYWWDLSSNISVGRAGILPNDTAVNNKLVGWYKADVITGVADGGLITNWSDSGQYSYNATANSSSRPNYTASVLNGKPAVWFNGSNGPNFLALPKGHYFTNITVFLVARWADGKTTDYYPFIFGGLNNVAGEYYGYETRGANTGSSENNLDVFPGFGHDKRAAMGNLTQHMQWKIISSVTTNGIFDTSVWVNGSLPTMSNMGSNQTIGFWLGDDTYTSAAPASIGGIGGSPLWTHSAYDSNFRGHIAELIVYNDNLTTAQRQGIETYLANKYKIKIATTPQFSYYNGTIDEFRIYNRSLTSAEINDSYNRSFAVFNSGRYWANVSNLPDGTHTYSAYIRDNVNNTNQTAARTIQTSQSSNFTVTECNDLATANSIFTLTQDIAATGTCLNIGANNITIKCGNFVLTGDGSGYGINTSNNNATIQGCKLGNFSSAVYGSGNLSLTTNLTTNGTAIQLTNNGILDCGIYSIVGNGSNYGLFLSSANASASNCTISNFTNHIYLQNNASLILLNATFNGTTAGFSRGRYNNLTVKWYLDVIIQNGSVAELSPDAGGVLLMHFNNDSLIGENYNNSNGSVVYDYSPAKNNGTLYTGASGQSIYNAAGGKYGGAFEFDGKDDHVSIPDSPSLDPSSAISITAWVKLNGTSGYPTIASKQAGTSWADPYARYNLRVDSVSNKWEFWTQSYSGRNLRSTSAPQTGVWTFITATYDGNTEKIYINGILENTLSVSGSITDSIYDLAIGSHGTGGNTGEFFNGTIDEVAIYNRTLNGSEVYAHYIGSVKNATLNITTKNGKQVFYGNTTGNGTLVKQEIVEYQMNGTAVINGSNQINLTYYTPHDIWSDKYAYLANQTNTTLNISRSVTLVIRHDNVTPVVTIDYPVNNSGYQNNTISTLNWSYTEENLLSCWFNWHNGSNTSLSLNTCRQNWTNFSGLGPPTNQNVTLWMIDEAGNSKSYRADFRLNTPPDVTNVGYTPNSTDDIDPNVMIIVTANISDADNNFGSVFLQYRNITNVTSAWQNITMTNGTGNWTGNLTLAPTEMNYSFRIWANDSNGDVNTSTITNITGYYDYTWSVNKTWGTSVAGVFSTNEKIGNLSFNNTGDFSVTFSASDNSPYGFFGLTFNGSDSVSVTLDSNATSKKAITYLVNATYGSSAREDNVTITVVTDNANSTPINATFTFLLTSYAGGPYFDLRINNYVLSINQSQNISLGALVKNIGNQTASNISLNWTLPGGFLVYEGDSNLSLGNLTSGSLNRTALNATITTSVTAGTYVIRVNISGVGSPPVNDTDNITITIYCNSVDGACGAGCTYDTTSTFYDSDCSAPSSGGTSSGGGGGGGALVIREKKVVAEAVYELVRGKTDYFILPINNKFKGTLSNIKITVSGFLSKYIKIDVPKSIPPNSTGNATINIIAPKYFTTGEWNLTVTIDADIVENDTKTWFNEKRYVLLSIHELSREEAQEKMNTSTAMIEKIEQMNIGSKKIKQLLEEMKAKFKSRDYEAVSRLEQKINQLAEKATLAYSGIKDLEEKIILSSAQGIETPDTSRLLMLAKLALTREDYDAAITRTKEAQYSYAIETKGEFNLAYFLKKHWNELLYSFIALNMLVFVILLQLKFARIKHEMASLEDEEKILIGLMKVVQAECFEKNKMSMEEYREAMQQYENKLTKVVQRYIELETIRANFLNVKGKEMALKQEKDRLSKLIVETQKLYIEKGKIETRIYENKLKSYGARLSEVEESLALIEAERAIKRGLRFRLLKRNERRE